MPMCTIIATVQAILPYKCIVMLGMSTYINISSLISESTVMLNVESINGRFITVYVSVCFYHWLDSEDDTILRVYYVCNIMHDCIIALYGFKISHSPFKWYINVDNRVFVVV